MKTYTLEALKLNSIKNRDLAVKGVREVDPDFYIGKRHYDRPRKKHEKQLILERLRENEIFNR